MNGFRTLAIVILAALLNGQAVAALLSPVEAEAEPKTAVVEMPHHAASADESDCHEVSDASETIHDHCESKCGCCYSAASHVPLLLAQAGLIDLRPLVFQPLPGVRTLPGPDRERLLRPPIAHSGI
ncbi:MAG: hypothetical protein ACQES2_07465 [Pseudomonadota bacterium]